MALYLDLNRVSSEILDTLLLYSSHASFKYDVKKNNVK